MAHKQRHSRTRILRHQGEWFLLKALLTLLQHGPIEQALARTRHLARWAMPLLKNNHHWADTNLQLVYGPNLTAPQRQRLVQLVFENIFVSHVEGFRAADITFEQTDPTHLHEAMAMGRGALACSLHLGSWEPAMVEITQQGIPLTVVYRHANNPKVEAIFRQIRIKHQLHLVRRDQPRAILQSLKEKRMIGLMVDINTLHHGITAPFLGLPAQSHPGTVKMARKYGAPIVPMVCIRTAPGKAKLCVQPPLFADKNESDSELMLRLYKQLEPFLLDHAEQYNWLHGRWRARPDGRVWSRSTPVQEILKERTTPFLEPTEQVMELIR
ncbi:lysophospholipid acyltransferase family protein [Magnetococcus sp. PR-3]|uniref:lysophospholipid acyltransferase family protein n=1 Tax=Magnetococcus sp. PR-3 TaxID=3120355 RepID=UPI002FCE0B3B